MVIEFFFSKFLGRTLPINQDRGKIFLSFMHPGCIKNTVKTTWQNYYLKITFYFYIFQDVIPLMVKLNFQLSFRNHSNLPIWCSRLFYYYCQCWKHIYFCGNRDIFFSRFFNEYTNNIFM